MSTNPFSRNRRATARPPFTFSRPQEPPFPTQNFPVPPTHRRSAPSQPIPQVNTIPRAANHPRNPFHINPPTPPPPPPAATHGVRPRTAPPGFPPLPTNPPWTTPPSPPHSHVERTASRYADDEAYARAQANAHACGCPGRLYADHALRCPGPVSATATPLGRRGNAGSAIASVPPLVKLACALLMVGRFFMTGIVGFATWMGLVIVTMMHFVAFTVVPEVGTIVLALAYWVVVVLVLWWALTTAANIFVALTTWKAPATYYALKQGWLFLGNVSPFGGIAAPTTARSGVAPLTILSWGPVDQAVDGAPAEVASLDLPSWIAGERVVEAAKYIASYVVPATTTGVTAGAAEGISRKTLEFGACPGYRDMTAFPGYNIAATETGAGAFPLPGFSGLS